MGGRSSFLPKDGTNKAATATATFQRRIMYQHRYSADSRCHDASDMADRNWFGHQKYTGEWRPDCARRGCPDFPDHIRHQAPGFRAQTEYRLWYGPVQLCQRDIWNQATQRGGKPALASGSGAYSPRSNGNISASAAGRDHWIARHSSQGCQERTVQGSRNLGCSTAGTEPPTGLRICHSAPNLGI